VAQVHIIATLVSLARHGLYLCITEAQNARLFIMLNFGQLVHTVQHNCHISDARYAGEFTLCVYLLKMREYYRWEHELPLTRELPRHDVGSWLQEREQLWEGLESQTFALVPLPTGPVDPFQSETINAALVPHGYAYSAGYGRFRKPHFFLGRLVRNEVRDGCNVYVTACEYARDLEAPPAMLQGNNIFVRQESVRRFLWEKIEERHWNRNNRALESALAAYDLSHDLERELTRLTEAETETMVLHETGEAIAGRALGKAWEEMLLALPRRTEIMARAVRDLVADCVSTIPRLIDSGARPSLHFLFGNFSGMRRQLFPELLAAYREFAEHGSTSTLRSAARGGEQRWLETARQMLDLFAAHGEDAPPRIEALLESAGNCSGTETKARHA
jgi:hypothetical protein